MGRNKRPLKNDIALLTPLTEEKELLVAALSALGNISAPVSVGRLPCVYFEELGLLLAEGGHGKAQCGIQTQHLIENRRPNLIVCAGAAGSLHQDVKVGDLVAGTVTIEHDFMLRFVERPLPRFSGCQVTLKGLELASAGSSYPFKVHLGAIASGDEDVVCSERANDLASKTGALCVAWEGSGVGRASRFSELPFLELRAVTDHADKAAVQDFDANFAVCMNNLARLLHDWLSPKNGSLVEGMSSFVDKDT